MPKIAHVFFSKPLVQAGKKDALIGTEWSSDSEQVVSKLLLLKCCRATAQRRHNSESTHHPHPPQTSHMPFCEGNECVH